MDLAAKIEALLFYKAEPLTITKLAQLLGEKEPEVTAALTALESRLNTTGLCLMRKEDAVMLATSREASPFLEKIRKDELARDLGKATLETLSIILYRGPITRANIDYIRGVNSSYILRHLLTRGLIERVPNPGDARSFVYKPTFDLLAHLGITKLSELPEYEAVAGQVESFVASQTNHDGEPPHSEPASSSAHNE